jgi:hypothetical protein
MIFLGPSKEIIYNIINKLSKDLKVQSLGIVKDFLGINITFYNKNNHKGIFLS